MAMNPNVLRIDSKQKIKFIRTYIHEQLKGDKEMSKFLTFSSEETGFMDFTFVTKKRDTLQEIEKGVKDYRYETVRDFIQEIKGLMLRFSDYLLTNDPLQSQIIRLCNQIGKFEERFYEQFKQNKPKLPNEDKKNIPKEKPKPPPKAPEPEPPKKSTFAEKLEMCYFLKAHEDNYEYIRNLGESYGIGRETEDEYIITLDFLRDSCPWLELIQKRNY